MLTADINDKKATFKVAFMTGASIFVMGYLNALALNTYDLGTMITPQTGNVIWLGLNAAQGYWGYFLENLGLMMGFMGGAVFALFTQALFKNKTAQFYYNWTVFALPVALYPLVLQYVVSPWISFTLLGFASGAALGFFRKMYHMEINNAMATGNVRFLGLHFAGAFIKKNKKEVSTFFIFLTCVLAFAAGAFVYASFARMDYNLGLDINLGLGYVEYVYEKAYAHHIGYGYYLQSIRELGPGYGYDRLTLGLGSRDQVITSNVVRVVGLIAFCIIPYFFCPKHKA
ncbi:MAG: DUF1275 domain-containing protein [Defluviitaleaceae bacterium]|nr:DUF1275 domain-containing protein [Defluviitaleaceae bacterium]